LGEIWVEGASDMNEEHTGGITPNAESARILSYPGDPFLAASVNRHIDSSISARTMWCPLCLGLLWGPSWATVRSQTFMHSYGVPGAKLESG